MYRWPWQKISSDISKFFILPVIDQKSVALWPIASLAIRLYTPICFKGLRRVMSWKLFIACISYVDLLSEPNVSMETNILMMSSISPHLSIDYALMIIIRKSYFYIFSFLIVHIVVDAMDLVFIIMKHRSCIMQFSNKFFIKLYSVANEFNEVFELFSFRTFSALVSLIIWKKL